VTGEPSLVLAFDTATETASVALVRRPSGDVLGERATRAVALLRDAEALLAGAGIALADVDGIAVGIGPGRYTSLRMGLVTARALSLACGAPVAGVCTLDALAAGAPGARPVIDARRGEVFTAGPRPTCLRPEQLVLAPGELCVGDGAIRYRDVLERLGAAVPPDGDARHTVRAGHVGRLATAFGPAHEAAPLYLREPDAERTRREYPQA
jgi:tRNA threonylcarbamoyladenosine biosynthesis protein TsaB